MKRVVTATLFALTSTAALAQATPPPATPMPAPAPPVTAAPPPAVAPAPAVPAKPGAPDWSLAQAASEFRASKLIGLSVYNSREEKVGEVNELIVSDTGSVTHAVIGVGGFLGIGEKNVAVAMNALKVSRDKDGKVKALLDTTSDQLKAAPDYKYM